MIKKIKMLKRNFSLIELLIVIAIMGALTALILPQFSDVESDAKDTGCDYNNAGTLRYVTMFKAANSAYPTGFHTGLDASNAPLTKMAGYDSSATPTHSATYKNMTDATTDLDLGSNANALASLKNAGIETLAYGTDAADTPGIVRQISADWDDDGSTFTIKGKSFAEMLDPSNTAAYIGADKAIVPLFVASTVDWEKTADGKTSPVSIALEGKCPWLASGSFRYYICFFKVDTSADQEPAKLLGTACPECGSLDADAF